MNGGLARQDFGNGTDSGDGDVPTPASESLPRWTSIVVAANFTAGPIRRVLSYMLKTAGIDATISFAPHHQVTVQLLDPTSAVARNSHGINVVLVRLDTVMISPENSTSDVSGMLKHMIGALEACARCSTASWIVVSCPPPPRMLAQVPASAMWRDAEKKLQALETVPGVEVVLSEDVLSPHSPRDYYDERADVRAKIPFKPTFFAALAVLVARRIHACVTSPRKVLVIDCDNTLWSGICAECGPDGVRIDQLRRDLQEWILLLQRRGVLLCLCSKNDEADVWDVFERCPDMIVRRDDIVAWRINWLPKGQNIRALAQELQLGLDTFVFIDDDAMECAQMLTHLPEVVTLHCPIDADNQEMLNSLWVFDQSTITDDDRLRTKRYQQSREREQIRANTTTVAEFVAMLDVRISIRPADDSELSRIAQLTRRVTQCNCTLKYWSELELAELVRRRDYKVLGVHATDRYGDYGLVGAIIARVRGDVLEVDSLLLSCRALGRNIELRMMDEIEKAARAHQLSTVRLSFVPGPRNAVAKAFLDGLRPPWIRRDTEGGCEYSLHLPPA